MYQIKIINNFIDLFLLKNSIKFFIEIFQVQKEGYEFLSQPVVVSKERKVHVAGEVYSAHIGYTEVFLHPLIPLSSIEQPRRFNRHYNHENESINKHEKTASTQKINELTTPISILLTKSITHEPPRQTNSPSTGHRNSSYLFLSLLNVISMIIISLLGD
jgi:hypothetical protein